MKKIPAILALFCVSGWSHAGQLSTVYNPWTGKPDYINVSTVTSGGSTVLASSGIAFGSPTNTLTSDTNTIVYDDTNFVLHLGSNPLSTSGYSSLMGGGGMRIWNTTASGGPWRVANPLNGDYFPFNSYIGPGLTLGFPFSAENFYIEHNPNGNVTFGTTYGGTSEGAFYFQGLAGDTYLRASASSQTVKGPLNVANLTASQCVQTDANKNLISSGGSCGGGGGGGGQLIYPSTGTPSFPFGVSASTLTVSSNTILSGATFYQNGPQVFSGNVGIGTTTVGSRLVVQGSDATSANSGLNVTDSAGSSKLFVRNDGFVGIGATAPNTVSDKLYVTGDIRSSVNIVAAGDIYGASVKGTAGNNLRLGTYNSPYVYITGSTDGTYPNLKFGIGTATPGASLQVVGADSLSTSFAANISGATGTGLVVQNNGNVGIGTASPGTALDVVGTARVSTMTIVGQTFSTLGNAAPNGTIQYCSDCTVTTAATCTANLLTSCVCAGSGSGAFAKRLNGSWYCQ